MNHSSLLLACLFPLSLLGCSETRASASTPESVTQVAANQPAVTDCGAKGQPDCPLQGWMKDSVRAYMNAGDNTRLAASLEKLVTHSPAGYAGWEMSAKRAVDAARAGDTAAVKTECKSCHEQFRERFRSEMRGARLF